MTLFKHIVNEALLTEIAQSRESDIKKAINNVLRVRMSYNDKKGGKGKNERYILPVAFGLTKSGKKAVRAYQTAGSSKRGLTNPPNNRDIPKWKLFLVDNIYSWSNGKKSFRDYKDALINLGLNTHGDKSMTTLFAITPFADDDVQVAKTSNPITPEPIRKVDVEPTQKTQDPETTDTERFIPAGKSRSSSVDINKPSNYITDKMTAKNTEPITKSQITQPGDVGTEDNTDTSVNNNDLIPAKTEPITKDEINGTETKDDVTKSFNDMMDRMDRVYKDEDETEED